MVETFAANRYSEKFAANLTFIQTAIFACACVPMVLLIVNEAHPFFIAAYGITLFSVYVGLAFYEADEMAVSFIRYHRNKQVILWHQKRMRRFIGIDSIDNNTVHTADGRVLSALKVLPKDLGSLSQTDMERVIAGYGTFLNELSTNIQIIMSSSEIDVDGYLRRLRESVLLRDNPHTIQYLDHFSRFLKNVVSSKIVTDRDYYIVITEPLRDLLAESVDELDTKTKNIINSLKDSGIDCERLEGDRLVSLYGRFFQGSFKLTSGMSTSISFHNISPQSEIMDKKERLENKDISCLFPTSCEFKKRYAEIEKLHAVMYAARFPAYVNPGWLTKLIRQPIDFDLIFHIHPLSQKTSVDYLQHEITKLETDVTAKSADGLLVAEKDRVLLSKAKELLNRVSRDEERCFDMSMYLNVKAYVKKDLDVAIARLKDICEGMGVNMRASNWEMEEALRSCYPIAKDVLGQKELRLFPSSAVRDSYPFILSCLEDSGSGSVLVGYNQFNGIPVLFDPFTQQNPHTLVLGSSGSGKSFLVKKLLLSMGLQDMDIFIIDPQGEYSEIVRSMGGAVLKLSPDSNSTINLFDLKNDTYDERKQSIKAFFRIILAHMKVEGAGYEGVLDKMIDVAYRKAGIFPDDQNTSDRTPPTLTGIYEALNQFAKDDKNPQGQWKRNIAEGILTNLGPFIFGDLRYFNQQNNLDLEGKRIICFDTSYTISSKPLQRALSLFIVFDFIQSWVKANPKDRRKMIIVDEAWTVFENTQDYLSPIVRTGRKIKLGVMLVDQNVEDLLAKNDQGVQSGHVILNNTSTKFILRQESSALKLVAEKFGLTDSQRDFLINSKTGDVLLMTPHLKLPLYVLASSWEKNLIDGLPKIDDKKHSNDVGKASFDPRTDSVIPSYDIKKGVGTLLEEGFRELADFGLARDSKTIYYVKNRGFESDRHLILKKLIEKSVKSFCGKSASVELGQLISPDIKVSFDRGEIYVEIVDDSHFKSGNPDFGKVERLIKAQENRDIIFVVGSGEIGEKLRSIGADKVFERYEFMNEFKRVVGPSLAVSEGA